MRLPRGEFPQGAVRKPYPQLDGAISRPAGREPIASKARRSLQLSRTDPARSQRRRRRAAGGGRRGGRAEATAAAMTGVRDYRDEVRGGVGEGARGEGRKEGRKEGGRCANSS
ncbi:hypothetical protein ACJRO7_023718 [Eucalyptus globulus]|uniref:Uncharacterized protein n=1 Tax=Eucalyptus globulus TaxID=34317 RepID=A0ABD3K9Q3_EUCGL